MGRLDGKTAIITGGSGGIGAAAGALFSKEGANVMLVDVDEDALHRVQRGIESPHVSHTVADVAREDEARRYVQATLEHFGGLDIVFANAGIEGKLASIAETLAADFDRVLAVNLRGAWLALKFAIPAMTERRGGSIMVTSSVAGMVGFAGLAPYVCSKHALTGLVRTASLECAAAGIRVNAIHPGPVANRMMRSLEAQLDPEQPAAARRGFEEMVPLGRYASNEDIARLALFLASDDSAYCTGAAFVADGGFTAR